MAANDPLLPEDPLPEYVGDEYGESSLVNEYDEHAVRSPWAKWRWLLIPFLVGIALLGWGVYRLRHTSPHTIAEQAIASCQYRVGDLSLSADDENVIVDTVEAILPHAGGNRAQTITAAQNVCLAHLCRDVDPRLENLSNITAEEFAFAVTAGNLLTTDLATSLANDITGAPWCHS